jgi:hypothetical protein
LLILPSLVFAGDGVSKTHSASGFINDDRIQLSQQLEQSPLVATDGQYLERDGIETLQFRLAYHAEVEFEIFDAWLELSDDLDDDGFYHQLQVSFDADVTSDTEAVYAKLYLSRDGGPWLQYAQTDLFEIQNDSADDSYQVLTELVAGYPPGYYDILIQLHSLYHPGIVASHVIDAYDAGFAITLEDRRYDEPGHYREHDYTEVRYGVGVSGAFDLGGLFMLGLPLLLKIKSSRATRKFWGMAA